MLRKYDLHVVPNWAEILGEMLKNTVRIVKNNSLYVSPCIKGYICFCIMYQTCTL